MISAKYPRLIGMLAILVGVPQLLAAPANDNFANAQVLPSQKTISYISGTTTGATIEPGDPDTYADSGNDCSVWYVWTAPESGIVAVSVVSDVFKSGVVMIGDALFSSKIVRDQSRINGHQMAFYAVAGQTYRFAIYNNQYHSSDFELGLGYLGSLPADTVYVPPFTNDDFANAVIFGSAGQKAVFYTYGGTPEPFEADMLSSKGIGTGGAGDSVWARWQAPVTGKATLTAISLKGATDVVVLVGVGDSLNDYGKNLIANANGGVNFNCQAGVEYRFYFLSRQDDQIFATISSAAGNGSGGGGNKPPAPFALQSGTFDGLVGTDGYITVAVQKTGAFTGKLILATGTYALKGKLDANGDFVGNAGRSAVPLELHLSPGANASVPAAIAITGATNGGAFEAHHTAYNKVSPRREVGKYTVLLSPMIGGVTVPQGVGMGHLTVEKTGKTKLVGRLGDGTAFSVSNPLVGDGSGGIQSVFYSRAIYAKKGLLAGAIAYDSTAASDASGTVKWVKPQQKKGAYYVSGFTAAFDLKAQRYVRPAGSMALNLMAGIGNASVTLTGGGLPMVITEEVTLSTANKVTVSGVNAEKLKIAVNAATGDVSGSFVVQDENGKNKTIKFKGALFQNPNSPAAGGYFLGPVTDGVGLSGSFSLTP